MKLSNFGRIALALVASLVLAFGTQSCHYNFTEAYIIVTGSQYNQVASYKEDNDTGALVGAKSGVQSSGGANPIRAVLASTGRYVYVLNQGTPKVTDAAGAIQWTGAGISLFSIGGDGSLSFQLSYPSQGLGSRRMALSNNGAYLYVLDQYQPGPNDNVTPGSATQSASSPCYDSTNAVWRPAGDITVFSIDSATGRLFLVQNQQQQNSVGTPLSYFPIGCGAIDFCLGSGFLWTAEASDPASGDQQVVYTYAEANTTGQLTQVAQAVQPITGATDITVINGSTVGGTAGSYVYVLDSGTNNIFIFTPGSQGQLNAISVPSAPNPVPNNPLTGGMTALTTDSSSKYLYITNTTALSLGQANSLLSLFTIDPSSGALTPLGTGTYPTGSNPVCIFEDPSKQYMYTADSASSTVVGAAFDPETGTLTALPRGSTFPVIGTPTWCLVSSHTD
jgi:6-phosphogluconolactonase (cycloisomerase 2 family)